MAVRHARDERAEPHARGLAGDPREQRPRLEGRAAGIAVERLEVVEDPDAVEAGVLGERRARDELVPRELVLRDVEPPAHRTLRRLARRRRTARRSSQRPMTPAPPDMTGQALALAVPDAVGVLGPHRLAHRLVDLARIADHPSSICPWDRSVPPIRSSGPLRGFDNRLRDERERPKPGSPRALSRPRG